MAQTSFSAGPAATGNHSSYHDASKPGDGQIDNSLWYLEEKGILLELRALILKVSEIYECIEYVYLVSRLLTLLSW